MAALGGLESILGGLEAKPKKILTELVRAAFPFLRFGPVEHQTKAENFQGYYLTSTTAGTTGEFSIEHGLGVTPYLVKPVLDLSAVGARLVPLTVTKAADTRRIYLKTESGYTNAVFSIYVE